MKQLSTRTITIIISLIALALLALGVFVTQKDKKIDLSYQDFLETYGERVTLPEVDTTGWETYRDEDFGFEFQYPADEWDIYLPRDNRVWMQEYLAGAHREKEKPMHWDTAGVEDESRSVIKTVICLTKKGFNNNDGCEQGFPHLEFSFRGPNWGSQSGEELVMEDLQSYMESYGKIVQDISQYAVVNGLNIEVHEYDYQDIYTIFVQQGLQLEIKNNVFVKSGMSEQEWKDEIRHDKEVLQSIVQTFDLID